MKESPVDDFNDKILKKLFQPKILSGVNSSSFYKHLLLSRFTLIKLTHGVEQGWATLMASRATLQIS